MKPSELKKHAPLIYSILGCKNPDGRNVILSNLNDSSLDFICECLREIIYHPHKLNIPDKKIKFLRSQLAKDKKKLLYLINKKTNRKRKAIRISRKPKPSQLRKKKPNRKKIQTLIKQCLPC